MNSTSFKLYTFIIFFFSTQAYADMSSFREIQKLNKDYIICNNIYTNTGSLTNYQRCLEDNYNSYDTLIKDIRMKKNFKDKDKWASINKNINTHNILCRESLERTSSPSTHKEISFCNQLMYRSLAIEAFRLNEQ